MKKLAILFLFFLSGSMAFAQFGFKAGVNASNVSTDDENIEDIQSKLGYQLGFLLDIPISETVWICPELIYIRKGAKYQNLNTDVRVNMNYLDIPLTVAFRPKLLPVNIHIGAQASYLINTELTYENGLLGSTVFKDTDRDNYEDFDMGLILGVGLQINDAFLQLRYTHSLNEYEKSNQIGGLSIEPASKHFNLQMSLGYLF